VDAFERRIRVRCAIEMDTRIHLIIDGELERYVGSSRQVAEYRALRCAEMAEWRQTVIEAAVADLLKLRIN